MNSDDLLNELAKRKREEDSSADNPRWEKLARGDLSPAEEAELRTLAAKNPEVALLYEAYRPLSAEAKEKIVARIANPAGAKLIPLRPWRRIAVIALPLAAAAAFVVWTSRPASTPVASLDVRVPTYALEVSGGDWAQRSTQAATGPITLQRDSRLELVLRPATPSSTPVTVRGFLVQGNDVRTWAPSMQRSADGPVRVVGTADTLGLGVGTWDVVFAIGSAEAVPTNPHVVATALGSPSNGRSWQLLRTRVTVNAN